MTCNSLLVRSDPQTGGWHPTRSSPCHRRDQQRRAGSSLPTAQFGLCYESCCTVAWHNMLHIRSQEHASEIVFHWLGSEEGSVKWRKEPFILVRRAPDISNMNFSERYEHSKHNHVPIVCIVVSSFITDARHCTHKNEAPSQQGVPRHRLSIRPELTNDRPLQRDLSKGTRKVRKLIARLRFPRMPLIEGMRVKDEREFRSSTLLLSTP